MRWVRPQPSPPLHEPLKSAHCDKQHRQIADLYDILDQIVRFWVVLNDCFILNGTVCQIIIPKRNKMQNEGTLDTCWIQNTAF